MELLWVSVGGFAGAISRYALIEFTGKVNRTSFPAGTLLVNLVGSFLLGLLYGATDNAQLILLLGTGFLGAFTTFSTFQFELVQLGKVKKWGMVAGYVLVSVIFGILLAAGGYQLAHQLRI